MEPNTQSLRESPTQPKGFVDSFRNAVRGWRNSTQTMTPLDAIRELSDKVNEYFQNDKIDADFYWLDRINRLLWVLTSKGDILLQRNEDLQKVLRIWEIVSSIYQSCKYPPRRALDFARNDPRKENLEEEELLLQISGRCRVLVELYVKVHNSDKKIKDLLNKLTEAQEKYQSADDRISELNAQLKGTLEEEERLSEKLRNNNVNSLRNEFAQKFEELQKHYVEKLTGLEEANKQLHQRELALKSENGLLKQENRSLQERISQMSIKIWSLEAEIEELKQKKAKPEDVVILQENDERKMGEMKELIKVLRTENANLNKEINFLREEMGDVVAHREATLNLRTKILTEHADETEALETAQGQIKDIKKAVEEAYQSFQTTQNHPLNYSEALSMLLTKLDMILNK
jgi:chromosome segregation ATPase